MTDVPHFDLPFRFATPHAAVVEQDTVEDVSNCVYAILVCPLGFRVELPAFGIDDPTFAMPGPELDELRDEIETWEERAGIVLDAHPDALDVLISRVGVNVSVRSEA